MEKKKTIQKFDNTQNKFFSSKFFNKKKKISLKVDEAEEIFFSLKKKKNESDKWFF